MPTADDVFRRFEFELTLGKDPIFHGGELITGNLKIELKRPMTIQAIKLQFKGRAACTTSESSKGAEIEKVYFDRDFTLLERPPGRPEPGHFPWIADFLYSLPFECPLPIGCPTSYENPHGFIRYFIRATVVEETKTETREYIAKKALSVVAPVESLAEIMDHPIGASETVSFGGCCCHGKLSADVQLPKSTYAPGEPVVGSIKIDNRHPRHVVDLVEVRLVDRVTYVGAKSSNVSPNRTLVCRRIEKSDVVKSKSSIQKDEVNFLTIPPVAPTIGMMNLANNEVTVVLPDQTAAAALLAKFAETPGTATLKFRKQPFLRIDYSIQLSLGDRLLLELPITITPLPIRGDSVVYQPFIAGPQPIPESDESGKFIYGDGFLIAPQYPVLSDSLRNGPRLNGNAENGATRW